MATLADVLAGVSGLVAALTPSVDPGSAYVPVPLDAMDSLESWGAIRARAYDVQPSGAPYPGDHISSADLGFASCRIAVRVAYPVGMLRDRWSTRSAAAVDVIQIMDELRDPASWGAFAFELTPETETQIDEVTGESGAPVGFIATVEAVAEWEV